MLRACLVLLLLLCTPLMAAQEEALEPGGVNPGYHEQPDWFKQSFLDLGEDVAEASAAGKHLLLYFYQDGCPYCAKLLRDNFGQRPIAEKTRQGFDVVALNIWGDREVTDTLGNIVSEKAFAERMKVMYTPTLVFLDGEGRPSLRLNGYYPPGQFTLALDYAAGRANTGTSFSDYLAAYAVQEASGRLHSEAYFMRPPLILERSTHPAERPLLVIFEQKQCRECDELHADILQRPGVRQQLQAFDVVQLDRWAETPLVTPSGERRRARAWADELQVQYTPTLVYFDGAGREVFRSEAYLKAFHTESVMAYVASGAYRQQPNLQRFIQERADHLREQGIEVDLWK